MWGLAIAFTVIILIGTALLMLPGASTDAGSASFLTALFTATSATLVTGLIVVDTGTYWSGFGQTVILTLIQLGGLGYMTGVVFIVLLAGRRVTLAQRQVLRITFGGGVLGRVDVEARTLIIISIVIQIIGVLLLFTRFAILDGASLQSAWQAIFHAVSAFHNAGFEITGGAPSIFEYRRDPWILFPLVLLSLIGALGMTTVITFLAVRRWRPLTLDAKLVFVGTGILIAVGFLGILISEWTNPASLGDQSIAGKLLDPLTLSVGNRTAGFSTFEIGAMRDYTLFLLIALMFIGGASGSMTGGIKVNVFSVLLFTVWSSLRGKAQTVAFRREISDAHVRRALAITFISFLWINAVSLLLSLIEQTPFLDLLFEVVSAFGLVGLSTGITPDLSVIGKFIIIVSMFVGRLAPFMIALELARREVRSPYRYAREEVRIG